MAGERKESDSEQQRGLPEGLRAAVERTFAATTGGAATTRGRAQELVDEIARRGQEARDASAGLGHRVVEAIQDMRLATAEDLRRLSQRIASIEQRLERLERAVKGGEKLARAPRGAKGKRGAPGK